MVLAMRLTLKGIVFCIVSFFMRIGFPFSAFYLQPFPAKSQEWFSETHSNTRGKWNQMEMLCEGDTASIRVKGHRTLEGANAIPQSSRSVRHSERVRFFLAARFVLVEVRRQASVGRR